MAWSLLSGRPWHPKCDVSCQGLWVAFSSKILHVWGNMHDWHILMTEGITFNGVPMTSCWPWCSTSELLCANCTSSETFAISLDETENRGSHFICRRKTWRLIAHLLTGWQVDRLSKPAVLCRLRDLSARILFPANSYARSYLPISAAHLPSLSSPSPKKQSLFPFYLSRNHLVSTQFLCLSLCAYLQISSRTHTVIVPAVISWW